MTELLELAEWDCGGDCIFGDRAGPERNCDECWENCWIVPAADAPKTPHTNQEEG